MSRFRYEVRYKTGTVMPETCVILDRQDVLCRVVCPIKAGMIVDALNAKFGG